MALNFLRKEINNKKRKAEEMNSPVTGNGSQWVTRGQLEKQREAAYLEEQAKLESERKAVRHMNSNCENFIVFIITPYLCS